MSWMKQASGLLLPKADLAACGFRFGVTDSSESCCGEPNYVKVTITGIGGGCAIAHCHLISPLVVYLPITSFSSSSLSASGPSALDHYFWTVCPIVGISEHYGSRYSAYVTINTNPAASKKISFQIGKWNYPCPNWVFTEIAEFYTGETITGPLRHGWSHTFSGSYKAEEYTNGPLCDFSGYSATVKIVDHVGDDETVISSSYGKKVLADYDVPESLLLTVSGVGEAGNPPSGNIDCGARFDRAYVCDFGSGYASSTYGDLLGTNCIVGYPYARGCDGGTFTVGPVT